MTKTEDPQTYWKRIKVPAELRDAGWVLVKRDSTAPFALVNEQLGLDTGGFPDPQEAISAAAALMIERAEAEAISAEGNGNGGGAGGERPQVLPIALVDEGWRLIKHNKLLTGGGFRYSANRDPLTTDFFEDAADAVAAAIAMEADRQAEIEQRELGDQTTNLDAQLDAQTNGSNGHKISAPAEIMLTLDRIRTDGGTQQRALFDQAVLADYCEVMHAEIAETGADHFPAVDVFFDGADYWLADGFYRLQARQKLGQATVAAQVREGTQRDAILFSLGANARHGLPRTPDDKRRAVLVMLRDPEWAAWSDAYIAERVHVSVPFVRKLRRQEAQSAQETAQTTSDAPAPAAQPTKRRGRDGRVQDTARIGSRAKTEDPQLPLDAEASASKNKKAPNAASAKIELCADCDKEITAGDYQNDLGQCWDCAGMDKKRPRSQPLADSAASSETKKSATPDRPTTAQVLNGGDLLVSFLWRQHSPKRVVVTIAQPFPARGPRSELDLPSILVWAFLPDKVMAEIQKRMAPAKKPRTTSAHLKRKPAPAKKKTAPAPKKKTKPAPAKKRTTPRRLKHAPPKRKK